MTNLNAIDRKIQEGYELINEAEWHFVNSGYLYKYITPNNSLKVLRDHGVNRFEDNRGCQNKKEGASGFLKTFYRGKNEDRKERYLQ